MPKCDSNKVAEIALRHGCSVNLLDIFGTPFPRNTSEWLLLPEPQTNWSSPACFFTATLAISIEDDFFAIFIARWLPRFINAIPFSSASIKPTFIIRVPKVPFRFPWEIGIWNLKLSFDFHFYTEVETENNPCTESFIQFSI